MGNTRPPQHGLTAEPTGLHANNSMASPGKGQTIIGIATLRTQPFAGGVMASLIVET